MSDRNLPADPVGSRPIRPATPKLSVLEALEDRRLLSASVVHHAAHAHVVHHATAKHAAVKHASTTASTSTSSSTSSDAGDTATETHGRILDTIQFSQAPAPVQSGLTMLASTDGLAAPTSTQTVYLSNNNGVESYALVFTSTGTVTRIAVDQTGAPITDPTATTTTWATLSGTGTGSNAAASAEISAIATALALTAPTDTTTVNVRMVSGVSTYSVSLTSSTDTSKQTNISVDSNGNPVGNQTLPFSVIPTAIQTGINNNLPTGATALAATSTQDVRVLTENGVTFYSTDFTVAAATSTVTVNSAGKVITLPNTTTTTFSAIPTVTQTELQTLATADGITTTISASQSVAEYDEGNGTIVYSVTLSGTNSSSQTFTVTISADQLGNPTVPPHNRDGGGCGGGDGGGWPHGDFGAVDFGNSALGGGFFLAV